jgi:hyperosmotically inducible periplasmic protein
MTLIKLEAFIFKRGYKGGVGSRSAAFYARGTEGRYKPYSFFPARTTKLAAKGVSMKKQIITSLILAALAGIPVAFTSGCAVARHQETASAYGQDAGITAKIKADLYKDPDVKGTEVHVTTMNGVVQLSGFVETEQAKQKASEIARSIPGVMDVHNDLILPTGR